MQAYCEYALNAWVRALLALFLLANAGSASAQAAGEYGASATVRREKVAAPVAVSDLRLTPGELVRVPRADAQQLLTLTPGVLLTNHGGEGHAASMFMRGFDAGEGENFETQVQGVPLNELSNHHGHGYADTTFLPPEVVKALRVVQGPFDPAQGDFAVAGSVDYELGLTESGLTLKSALGSYRRRRLFLGYRPAGERAGSFLAVNLERGDGFGIQRSFGKASALGQYDAKLSAGTYLRTLAFAAAQRWDSAGVIRGDDFRARSLPCARRARAQFFCTHDPNQGGSSQRAGFTTLLERSKGASTLRAQAFLTLRGIRTRENFTGFSQDPRIDGPQRGDLRDGRTEATTVGARGLGRTSFVLFGQEQVFEAGVFARHDIVSTTMDRVRRELDIPYLTDFERDVRQTQIGVHARIDLKPLERVRLSLGGRADAFASAVSDRDQPTEDRIGERLGRESSDAYGFALSPRASLDVLLVEGLHWVTSLGGGARSSDASALSQSESAPFARIWSAESGLSLQRSIASVQLEGRASSFTTSVARDLIFDPELGRNQPAGATQRVGAMASLRSSFVGWFDLLGSASYSRAHFGDSWFALGGERVPFVPTWIVRVDGVLHHAVPGLPELEAFAALGLASTGKRPLPDAHWAAPYAVADAATGFRYRFLELSAAVTNLFDARYRSAELHYPSNWDAEAPPSQVAARHFSAGAPRQWLVSLTAHAF